MMKVWHLDKQAWVEFKKWMLWCDVINTKGVKE